MIEQLAFALTLDVAAITHCRRCGKPLRTARSRLRGIGPECIRRLYRGRKRVYIGSRYRQAEMGRDMAFGGLIPDDDAPGGFREWTYAGFKASEESARRWGW